MDHILLKVVQNVLKIVKEIGAQLLVVMAIACGPITNVSLLILQQVCIRNQAEIILY